MIPDGPRDSIYNGKRDQGVCPDRASGAGNKQMKPALNIVAGILVLFGAIWFLQGIGILPGSFMSGDIRWAFYGGVAMSAGLVMLLTVNRRQRAKPQR